MKYNKKSQKLYLNPKLYRIFDLSIVSVQVQERIKQSFLKYFFSKCCIRDGALVEMAISPCLILLPISLSSKDVQNSICSPWLSFLAGLLVQRWEADFKEKWALQNEARRRWDVLSAHRLHHQWWRWQLHYHGCQPPGGEAGFCAVLHPEEGALDVIVNETLRSASYWGLLRKMNEKHCDCV